MDPEDDESFYGPRKWQSDPMDIGFADILIEDPLQYHRRRPSQLEGQVYIGIQDVAV